MALNAKIGRELPRNLKEIYLRSWEECTGSLLGLVDRKDKLLMVVLSNHKEYFCLVFANGSPEAEIIRKEIHDLSPWKKIGIIKTGDAERPILIRRITSQE